MNRRALGKLEKLQQRYGKQELPCLDEVEKLLWSASNINNQRLRSFWSTNRQLIFPENIEHWTSSNFGWSFPCCEAIRLIRRCIDWPIGRIIDIGAGRGLWTQALRREFGIEKVIGLDPESTTNLVLQCTFESWCDETGGPEPNDVLFASWLPCQQQSGDTLGLHILDRVTTSQPLIYVGSGPYGPAGTQDFYDHLSLEFEEYASEPLPRIDRSVFPRDFIRIYKRKRVK